METVRRREEEGREGTVWSSKARSKLQEVQELRPVSLLLCRSRENHLLQDDLCPEVTAGKSVQPRMKGHLLNKTSFFSCFSCICRPGLKWSCLELFGEINDGKNI